MSNERLQELVNDLHKAVAKDVEEKAFQRGLAHARDLIDAALKGNSIDDLLNRALKSCEEAGKPAQQDRAVVTTSTPLEINTHSGPTSLSVPDDAPRIDVAAGDDWQGQQPFRIQLARKGPGEIIFLLTIAGTRRLTMLLDNVVKKAIRLDPDYATGAERQIQELREELAKARAVVLDRDAKIKQLERVPSRSTGDENLL